MVRWHVKDSARGSQQLSNQQIDVLRMLWAASCDPWCVKDIDGFFIYANRAYLGIFGIKDDEILSRVTGLSDMDLLSLGAPFISFDIISKIPIKNSSDCDKSSFVYKFYYMQSDECLYFLFDKIPVTDPDGLIIGFSFHGKRDFLMTMAMLFDGGTPLPLSYDPPNDIFSLRELDVIFLLLFGYSSVRISECLGFTKRTSETYIYHIYSKAGVKNYFELLSYCNNNGFVNFVTKKFALSH